MTKQLSRMDLSGSVLLFGMSLLGPCIRGDTTCWTASGNIILSIKEVNILFVAAVLLPAAVCLVPAVSC